MAKDPESSYRPGPSRAWLKLTLRREGGFPIVGVANSFNDARSLVLARRHGRGLVYVGTVEYGVIRAHFAEIARLAQPLVRPTRAFYGGARNLVATWLEPQLVAQITYSELIDGRLRDPVYRGLRGDTPA